MAETYTVIKAFPMQGRACRVGDTLELHPRQAKWYVLDGRIAPVPSATKKKSDKPLLKDRTEPATD